MRTRATLPRPTFDFHARLGGGPDATEQLLATMDECGIDGAAVTAGGTIDLDRLSRQLVTGDYIEADADNDGLLAATERSGGRLEPFFFGNPHRDVHVYTDRAARFHGLELSPAVHGIPLVDARTETWVRAAGEVGHPVYVVCLDREGSTVFDFVQLANRFPAVSFVLGHGGVGNIDLYAIDLVASTSNVFVETSGGYTCLLSAALNRLGAHRLLFGTEFPLQHPMVELAKYTAVEVTDESWQAVAWDNAQRLLRRE